MRVLVTGAQGQVARALTATAPSGYEIIALSRAALDIADAGKVQEAVARLAPDVIISTAAYTAVDRAESEPELARAINVAGPANLARAARGARLIHLSTDFVFDGLAGTPYAVDAPTSPLSVYGYTKRDGELEVLQQSGSRGLVLRTAWVYSAYGKNFMQTMLRLMRERPIVGVVADQVGSPTSVNSLARILWKLVERPDVHGIQHWTDAGVASWYDFAVAIGEEAAVRGLVPATASLKAIPTSAYPTPARRPAYSVLDKSVTVAATGEEPRHWRAELRQVLDEVARG